MAGESSTFIGGLKRRLDGFMSSVTGINTTRDKKYHVSHLHSARKPKEWLEDLYADQALAKRIVNLFPDDGLRKWFSVDHELDPEIQQRLKALKAKHYLREGARKERLHGGAAVYIDILDGRTMDQPVNRAYPSFKVAGLRCIEIDYIEPVDVSGNQHFSQDAKTSEYFRIHYDTGGDMIVHRDRLLIFPGVEISRTYRSSNCGWGESVLRDCIEPLMAYSLTHGTVPTIIQDFIIGILSLHGLNELIDTDDDESLKGRLNAAITGESYVNKLVIDSQDSYSREVANVAGLDTLIRHPERWLSACSGIPHTKLLAESAGASLGEGGKSQKADWEEAVEAYQQDKLLEPCEKLVEYIGLELKIKEPLPLTFNPLRVLTEKEKAETRKIVADTDTIYIRDGVLLEEEVRQSRFGGEYSIETTLDEAIYSQFKDMADEPQEVPAIPEAG